MNIGEKIYNLRKEKGFSQEFVANKLEITRQTVSKWESGLSTPDFDRIVPICDLFDMTPNELFEVEVENVKEPIIQEPEEVEEKEDESKEQWRTVEKANTGDIFSSILIGLFAGFSIGSVVGEQFDMIYMSRIIGSGAGLLLGAIIGLIIHKIKNRK